MAIKKTASKTTEKKDASAFVDFIHQDKNLKSKIRKGWNDVIADGKKKGYKFTKQELRDVMKKRYGLKTLPTGDEPDTCVCIG